jgi:hypothetical protein
LLSRHELENGIFDEAVKLQEGYQQVCGRMNVLVADLKVSTFKFEGGGWARARKTL